VIAQPEEWSIENNRIKLASIDQVPLRLAWAITIHKSQGMTLDAAEINLSKAFVEGMGYVALSRIRSLANLKLMGINDTALRVSPKATDLDAILRQDSEAAVKYLVQTSPTDRQQLQERFIKSNRI
jgi:ATP-dependent exoDNAse (exonuclease V) alpha subunit